MIFMGYRSNGGPFFRMKALSCDNIVTIAKYTCGTWNMKPKSPHPAYPEVFVVQNYPVSNANVRMQNEPGGQQLKYKTLMSLNINKMQSLA